MGCLVDFHQQFAGMMANMPFLPAHPSDVPFVYSDAEIFPGLEEKHAIDVTRGQRLARQALHLPGWSPQRAAENLPSLEGRSAVMFISVSCPSQGVLPLSSHPSHMILVGIRASSHV